MVSFLLLNSVFLLYVCSQWQGNPNAVWRIGRNRNVLSNTHIPQRIQNVSTLLRNITQNVPKKVYTYVWRYRFSPNSPFTIYLRYIYDCYCVVYFRMKRILYILGKSNIRLYYKYHQHWYYNNSMNKLLILHHILTTRNSMCLFKPVNDHVTLLTI